jgi:hypothetical protein
VSRLVSKLQRGAEFDENAAHHRGLARELQERLGKIREMGPERSRKRHSDRGRLLVRERIERSSIPGRPSWSSCRSAPTASTTIPCRPG